MKISYDWKRVTFKTEPKELFEAEKSGAKPNTVRILGIEEYDQLRRCNPKKIIIQYQHEIFLRTITNIHATKGVFGKVIVVISWTNERHHHAPAPAVNPHSVPVEPGAHNMAIDPEDVQLPSTPSICLLNNEKCTQCLKRTQDESFVDICISKQMFETLQNSFSGRTMNSVVQELHETYLFKLAEERKPPIDLSQTVISLPRTLVTDLNFYRRMATISEFILELLELYRTKQAEERGPMHD